MQCDNGSWIVINDNEEFPSLESRGTAPNTIGHRPPEASDWQISGERLPPGSRWSKQVGTGCSQWIPGVEEPLFVPLDNLRHRAKWERDRGYGLNDTLQHETPDWQVRLCGLRAQNEICPPDDWGDPNRNWIPDCPEQMGKDSMGEGPGIGIGNAGERSLEVTRCDGLHGQWIWEEGDTERRRTDANFLITPDVGDVGGSDRQRWVRNCFRSMQEATGRDHVSARLAVDYYQWQHDKFVYPAYIANPSEPQWRLQIVKTTQWYTAGTGSSAGPAM